jgi:SAM-dependent methyltransferase
VNAPPDWFETFFSGLAVEFWKAAVPDSATAEDADFLWKNLRLFPGSRVLDVPCGHGRHALALAARGCAVTGVDISPEFLDAARESARERKLSVLWQLSDMRELPWKGEFDAAFCFGNSFGYLDRAGDQAFLSAASRALAAGGRFAIDYGQAAESILPRLEPRLEAEIGEFRFEEDTRYDIRSGRIENRFKISRGARSETKLAAQNVYSANELTRMLEGAGLRIVDLFGSPADAPFELKSPRLLLVAEKPQGSSPGTRG